jgi:hypothetical protein
LGADGHFNNILTIIYTPLAGGKARFAARANPFRMFAMPFPQSFAPDPRQDMG